MNIENKINEALQLLDDESTKFTDTMLHNHIPKIVDESGQFTQAFAEFYHAICKGVIGGDATKLYEISDMTLTYDEFVYQVSKFLETFLDIRQNHSRNSYGIDIQVNSDCFSELHRNLIGGFYVLVYCIEPKLSDVDEHKVTHLLKLMTKLWFTYKDEKFMLISKFNMFESV